MTDPGGLLRQASVVALVDWPSTDVPRTLVRAGYDVFSLNRLRATAASYGWYPSRDRVPEGDDVTVFEPAEAGDGYLVCRPAAPPATVDILAVYRPAGELPGLARLAVQLGATALWLLPGSASPEASLAASPEGLPEGLPEARDIAAAGGLAVIEGVDIAGAVRSAGIPLR